MSGGKRLASALAASAANAARLQEAQRMARLERDRDQANADARLLRAQLLHKQRELDALLGLQAGRVDTYTIKPTASKHVGEATLWLVASDWHVEELVDAPSVNGLNEYNLSVSQRRAEQFFQRGLRLMDMFKRDVSIKQVVIPLLGDFLSNSIHADLAESNLLAPIPAALYAVKLITSGLAFVLDQTKREGVRIHVPCKSGNHGRTTKERRVQTEEGNSLEAMMYAQVRDYFRNEPRITFDITPAYHSFVECYGVRVRVHHGHNIRYWGGIGGPTIAVLKAIAEWNTAQPADIDVFGHFHQHIDHESFVMNGSMIGWNKYAISVKARFQKPKQACFLIDKKRGKSISAPIMFD